MEELRAKASHKISDYLERAIFDGIKEETRNLLKFYRDECSANWNELKFDVLTKDILFNLGFSRGNYAEKHIEEFYGIIADTYNAVKEGIDTLDITDPKHRDVQKRVKILLEAGKDRKH